MASVADEEEEAVTGINVTPLVDITLVLLIIFMATAHIIAHRSMNLSLPKAAHADQTPTQSLQIVLEADKTLLLNNQKVTVEELAVNLGQMARLDPGLKVTVLGDEAQRKKSLEGLRSAASFALNSSTARLMCIEQNFGPHIEQKCATLAPSAGIVSSWYARAGTGSSARLN